MTWVLDAHWLKKDAWALATFLRCKRPCSGLRRSHYIGKNGRVISKKNTLNNRNIYIVADILETYLSIEVYCVNIQHICNIWWVITTASNDLKVSHEIILLWYLLSKTGNPYFCNFCTSRTFWNSNTQENFAMPFWRKYDLEIRSTAEASCGPRCVPLCG
jgi:hypothetical protein